MTPPDLNWETIKSYWENALFERLKEKEEKNKRYYGCAFKSILAECQPTEKLLREIAKKLNRDYEEDMTNK